MSPVLYPIAFATTQAGILAQAGHILTFFKDYRQWYQGWNSSLKLKAIGQGNTGSV